MALSPTGSVPPLPAPSAAAACPHGHDMAAGGGGTATATAPVPDALVGALSALAATLSKLTDVLGQLAATSQSQAGAGAIAPAPAFTSVTASGGGAAPTTSVHAGHGDMSMASVSGRPSESTDAQAAYAAAQAFVAKYPTEDSLKAAGFGVEPNGNHYRIWDTGLDVFTGGGASAAQAIVEGGKVVGLQLDTNVKGATPPAWNGVEWHAHGEQGWMTHVYADQPLDTAFVENGRMM